MFFRNIFRSYRIFSNNRPRPNNRPPWRGDRKITAHGRLLAKIRYILEIINSKNLEKKLPFDRKYGDGQTADHPNDEANED
jgi:hypothetical protein